MNTKIRLLYQSVTRSQIFESVAIWSISSTDTIQSCCFVVAKTGHICIVANCEQDSGALRLLLRVALPLTFRILSLFPCVMCCFFWFNAGIHSGPFYYALAYLSEFSVLGSRTPLIYHSSPIFVHFLSYILRKYEFSETLLD